MRSHIALARGLLGGLLLAFFLVGTALGYSGQVAALVSASGPVGPQACNAPITVSATVEELGGGLIADQPVVWAFVSGNIAGDQIADTTTTTNASGVATTQVTFACSARSVTLSAVADDETGTLVIVLSGDGLPRTDTAAAPSLPLLILAAIAVLIGAATILRRFSTAGR